MLTFNSSISLDAKHALELRCNRAGSRIGRARRSGRGGGRVEKAVFFAYCLSRRKKKKAS